MSTVNVKTIKLPHASGNSMSIEAPATNPASDLTLKLPATVGTAGQMLTTDGSGNLSWTTPGVTEIDQWSVTGDVTSSTDAVSNWARQNNSPLSSNPHKGTGMSHSSGVFTFPSTGYWMVYWNGGVYIANNDSGVGFNLRMTVDNGSNWTVISNIDEGDSGGHHGHMTDMTYLDITDVSNQKVSFLLGSLSSGNKLKGSSSQLMSNAMFIRLGDT